MELTIILVVLGLIFIVACVVGFIRWNARRITFWYSIK